MCVYIYGIFRTDIVIPELLVANKSFQYIPSYREIFQPGMRAFYNGVTLCEPDRPRLVVFAYFLNSPLGSCIAPSKLPLDVSPQLW